MLTTLLIDPTIDIARDNGQMWIAAVIIAAVIIFSFRDPDVHK